MAGENEPAKLLLPYLQRADELQKHEPLVAYYCRLYAMERGLKISQSERTKTTNSLLVSLMNQLEKDKKSLQLGPDDHLHLEGFAMNVFSKADKQDRAGKADLNTAKTFYAASIFFEIINQFGELQPDLEQKQKYAVWKAADIRKALKEGRKPVPGPPGGEKDLSVPPSTSSGDYDLESRSTDPALQDLEQRRTDVPFQDIEPRSDTIIRPSTGADYPPRAGSDAATRPTFESDSSPQTYDTVNFHHSANIPPPSTIIRPSTGADYPPQAGSDAATRPTFESDSSPQTYDTVNFHHSANIPPPSNLVASPSSNLPPSPYPADDYPSHTFHQPPSTNGSENYSQFYHQQAYQHEAQQHYPSHDVPSYSYPHFQSYPSFTESSLPTAPSHYPSQYQGSDASYSTTSAPSTTNYESGTQYNSAGGNGSVSEAKITAAQTYHYDSSYQPPPEKIAEAHKAARFAVGALAFDDVSVAVDYLKKSLELLTLPAAGH